MEKLGTDRAHKKMVKEMADSHNKKIGPIEPTEKEKVENLTLAGSRKKYGIATWGEYD